MFQQKKFVVGLDIGYSNVKIARGYNDSFEPEVSVFPAYATPDEESDLTLGRKAEEELKVYPNGNEWRVFTNRIGHRELHDKYHTSEMYKALFFGALIKATEGRTNVIDVLVTGLPVRLANSEDEREILGKLLVGRFEVAPGRVIVVNSVSVLSQGVGIMNDVINTPNLLSDDDIEFSNILVTDPGFFSWDYVSFERGERKRNSSGSSLNATSALIDAIVNELESEHPEEGVVDAERIETALRSKLPSFNNGFRNVEIEPLLAKVTPRIAENVIAELLKRTRQIGTIHIIISAGGGSPFYLDSIRKAFPRSRIIESQNPVASNAIGYWHCAVEDSVQSNA